MSAIMKRAVKKQLIHEMITIFCAAKHSRVGNCQICSRLEEYANMKIDRCPLGDSGISCSSCRVHCYGESERSLIKEVMKYAGPGIFLKSPLLTLRYFMNNLMANMIKRNNAG